MKYLEGSESDLLLQSSRSRGSEVTQPLGLRGSALDEVLIPFSSKSELDDLLSSDVTKVAKNKTLYITIISNWIRSILRRALIFGFVLGAYASFGLIMDNAFGELEVDKEIHSFRFIMSLIVAYTMMFWVFLGLVGTILGDWRWLYNPRFVVTQIYKLCHLLAERVQE